VKEDAMTVYIACPPVFPDGASLLLADTSAQLMDFALMLGLDPPEVHDAHTAWEHIDLTVGRRARALRMGAQALDRDALTAFVLTRRGGDQQDTPPVVSLLRPPCVARRCGERSGAS